MHAQLQSFLTFAAANKSRPATRFMVVEDALESEAPAGTRIALYKDYEFENVEIPTAPLLLQATKIVHNSVSLSWQPPLRGLAFVMNYKIMCVGISVKDIRNLSTKQTSTLVDDLEPFTVYK